MKSPLILACVGMALSFSSAPTLAQADAPKPDKPAAPAAGALDPAAVEFIQRSRSTLRSLNDASCKTSQTMVNDKTTSTGAGDFLGVIDHPKEGQASLKRFLISSKTNDFDAVWSFDGEKAYKLDRKASTFQSMKAPDDKRAIPVQDVGMVVPTWVYGTDVLSSPSAKLAAAKFLPDEELDGVKCRVVWYRVETTVPEGQAERSDEGEGKTKSAEPLLMVTEQTRHIGAPDLIPRKIDSKVFYTGPWKEQPAERSYKATYSNVRVNANPSFEAFLISPPAGYKTVDADERDLGIPSDKMPKLKIAAGDAAPDFKLMTPDGSEVTLASLKGRVVLLDFWATWCGPCKMAMPGLQSLHEKFQGKPVSIYGVDVFEPGKGDKAAKYMTDKKFTYGLLVEGDPLANALGISSIPTFILIGRDGKVVYTGVGFRQGHEEELAAMIEKALGA